MHVGTSELLDAFAALEHVPWTTEEDFRSALAATLAKSQEDRRVFDILFDRYFFRAVEREAVERGLTEQQFSDDEGYQGDQNMLDLDSLRNQIRNAVREGSDERHARPRQARHRGVRARGHGQRRHRRRRAADPAHAGPEGTERAGDDGPARPGRGAARAPAPVRAPPAARARAGHDRAHPVAAAGAAAARVRPRAADQPDPGPGGRAQRRHAAQAQARHPGPRDARPQARPRGGRAADDARVAGDGRRPPAPALPAQATDAGRSCSSSATSPPA